MVVSPLEQLISELITQPSLKSTKVRMIIEDYDGLGKVTGDYGKLREVT